MAGTTTTARPGTSRARGRRTEHGVPVGPALVALSVAAGVLAALSPARPTSLRAADALWSAGFAVVVVLAASRSRRLPTVWMAGVAGVVGVGGDASGVVAGVLSLAAAGAVALSPTRERLLGALAGLVAAQALLRGPSYGFVGLPALVALAAVGPVVASGWRMARSRERRLLRNVAVGLGVAVALASAAAVVAAIGARPDLDRGADRAEAGLDLLRDGDTAAAAAEFALARDDFERAEGTLGGVLGWPGRLVPVVGQQLRAVREVSTAGVGLGSTASQAATSADWGSLTADGGRIDLALVRSMQEPVAASATALDDALATVDRVRSPWLLGPLDRQLDELEGRLDDAAEEATTAADGLAVAPGLLGGDGPRRYFVAFATPGESRDGGGFVGAFAILEATDGSLEITRTGSTMQDLNPSRTDDGLVLPAGWESLYGGYDVARYPANLSASPDWPTDAQVAASLYGLTPGGGPVDGVLYADPTALRALLELTGPVEVPGVPEPLSAANAERYLLVDQYVEFEGENAERKDVLGDVARSVFDALVSRPLPGVRTLADVLGPAVAGGHLRVASLGPEPEQGFLERVELDGGFRPRPGADFLSLRSANTIPSKLDVFLQRDLTVEVDLDPTTGEVASTVTVALRNDAPDQGLPDYILGEGDEVPRGTNRSLVTLYSPLALDGVELDGGPAAVSTHQTLGATTYGVLVEVPAGASATLTYRLRGPAPAVLADTGTYELELIPQALARPDRLTVRVTSAGRDLATHDGALVEPAVLVAPVVQAR